jgi:ABC-2 type transport system permease protein
MRARKWGLRWDNVFRLGIKEFRSLWADPVLLFLIGFAFTAFIYTSATGQKTEVEHAAVAIVDEDHSELSREIAAALLEPYFARPVEIPADEIDGSLASGRFMFVVEVPPDFERFVLTGRRPSLLINVDATAMSQAGNGVAYIESIVSQEVQSYAARAGTASPPPVSVVARALFNPNLKSEWFNGVMQIINMITMLTVILTGAALIREREHGTVEHLLVMPVRPAEIMVAKIWVNGLVIAAAAILSLWFVVHQLLGVPIAGSLVLFVGGALVYQVAVAALGILLATFTGSMGQFGMLGLPVLIALNLLSGGVTPMDSMPGWLQNLMQAMPTPHFVDFSQAVLFRGATLDLVWPQLVALGGLTVLYFGVSLARFRAALLTLQS